MASGKVGAKLKQVSMTALYPQPDEENRLGVGAIGQHAGDQRPQDESQRADPQHQPGGRLPDAERLHHGRQQRARQHKHDAVLGHGGASQRDPQFFGCVSQDSPGYLTR